ncbi:MAG: alanyl-tRNA editing protein [Roseiflexaceae bacterium]
MPTERIYLQDDQCMQVTTVVTAVVPGMFATAASPFFVGGGGQPIDTGWVDATPITTITVDEHDTIWHHSDALMHVNQSVLLAVDSTHRAVVSRYHTALHILNTLALERYNAWLTGAAITLAYGRIDLAIEQIDAAMIADLQVNMNAVIAANHAVRAYSISPEEFAQRSDLLRTINVRPPVYQGSMRVVEIEGFDAQACGGTHVRQTLDIGPCEIYKTENKGKQNKRIYVRFMTA